jgi:hypothetical protein
VLFIAGPAAPAASNAATVAPIQISFFLADLPRPERPAP